VAPLIGKQRSKELLLFIVLLLQMMMKQRLVNRVQCLVVMIVHLVLVSQGMAGEHTQLWMISVSSKFLEKEALER